MGADKDSSNLTNSPRGNGRPMGNTYYDPNIASSHPGYPYDLQVQCPPHTTQRKLLLKTDLRVIPVLSILYLLAFLDRTNIANASVYGLQNDLRLTGTQYNTALAIFFVPYIVFEIPSNILLKRFMPHVWLSGCMFLFGLATVCQGLVQDWSGLLATRFFLGLAEAGIVPGSYYLIAMWYKRSEVQKRYSFFVSSTSLAGAFGGLLASAIGKLDGMGGYLGWRWIFILEGVLTCVVAFFLYFVVPDFPEDAKWLKPDEQRYIRARLEKDQGASGHSRRITPHDILKVFTDFKVFLGGFMYIGLVVPAYSYAFFAPGIIKTYGYSQIGTQLYSVSPWAASFVFSLIIAFFSDYVKHRFVFALFPICIAIAGFATLLPPSNKNLDVQYAALCLVAMGAYSALPVIACWFNMNLSGHHRRSVGTAWQVGFGNIGGIISTYAFIDKDASGFKAGYGVCIGFACLSALTSCAYAFAVTWQNRSRERAGTDLGLGESEKGEMGDLNPDYRYLL